MATTTFDRDGLAKWYAVQHLNTDPGIVKVYYLPENAGPREIRFLEVNELVCAPEPEALKPIDFGVDMGSDREHSLLVIDVTPAQLEQINSGDLQLPAGWTLDSAVVYPDE